LDRAATRATLGRADDEDAAKTAKVLGRYLVPYLETREPLGGPSGGLKPGRRASG
jgi:hypothetical protein